MRIPRARQVKVLAMVNWDRVKYFKPEEFDDPDFPGSGTEIDPVTLLELCTLRRRTGWPIITHAKVGGCVDVEGTHGHAKHSYHRLDRGAKAVDFHFRTTADSRIQFHAVAMSRFTGIGIYYDWHWDNMKLPIGFHVDTRGAERTQIWKRTKREYFYLLL